MNKLLAIVFCLLCAASAEAQQGMLVSAKAIFCGDTLPVNKKMVFPELSFTDSAAVIMGDTGLFFADLDRSGIIKHYTFVTRHISTEQVSRYNKQFGEPVSFRREGTEIAAIWRIKAAGGRFYGAVLTSSEAKGATLRVGL